MKTASEYSAIGSHTSTRRERVRFTPRFWVAAGAIATVGLGVVGYDVLDHKQPVAGCEFFVPQDLLTNHGTHNTGEQFSGYGLSEQLANRTDQYTLAVESALDSVNNASVGDGNTKPGQELAIPQADCSATIALYGTGYVRAAAAQQPPVHSQTAGIHTQPQG